jgi:hypothetical protein
VSLWPLPGFDDADDDEGCANCEHIRFGHYDGGCDICDDVGLDCPGYEAPGDG